MKKQKFTVVKSNGQFNGTFIVGKEYELNELGCTDEQRYTWTGFLKRKGSTLYEKWIKDFSFEISDGQIKFKLIEEDDYLSLSNKRLKLENKINKLQNKLSKINEKIEDFKEEQLI